MPSCEPRIISAAVPMIQALNPKKIIEIGIGLGKWGLLCREYLDAWQGRPFKQGWFTYIVGVEAFGDYVQPWHKHIYDEVIIEEALPWLDAEIDFTGPKIEGVDLVLAMDVLEHMRKDDALEVIRLSCQVAKDCIFSIPLGDAWLDCNQSYLAINPLERHLSTWDLTELEVLSGCEKSETVIIPGARGPIGVFHFLGRH